MDRDEVPLKPITKRTTHSRIAVNALEPISKYTLLGTPDNTAKN